MKLSLAWIFDHIDGELIDHDIDHIVTRFNEVTAEIEHYYEVNLDLRPFALGQVTDFDDKSITLTIPEWKTTATISKRDDVVASHKNNSHVVFMVRRVDDKGDIRWAECSDFNLEKDGYLSAFSVEEKDLKGDWKKIVETRDVILEIDNKSITHRPDMWGHRGVAREIAAFLDLKLIDEKKLIKTKKCTQFEERSKTTKNMPVVIYNKAQKAAIRFSGLYCSSLDHKPSDLGMAFRLMSVGSRAIDAIVDVTNYVMLDWSQPLHVFDAEKIGNSNVVIRMASKGEKLTLLDESIIELTPDDLVIADAKKPMALAGVMGGADSGITNSTKTLFLEAAHFDATTIRRISVRHRIRTEASARFEKTLDPNQITIAIMRFLFLAEKCGLALKEASEIVELGVRFKPESITVSHDYIQDKLGFELSSSAIVDVLKKLEFNVNKSKNSYIITPPSFRGAKDVTAPEDILEEIVRFYGFKNIELILPAFVRYPATGSPALSVRKIKAFMRDGAHMLEQQNYAFFEETFLSQIGFEPRGALSIKNPVSENQRRLLTTLVTGLFKNICDNWRDRGKLSFFELGRVWFVDEKTILEHKRLTGIFFDKKEKVDFYECKNYIINLYRLFGIGSQWKKCFKNDEHPWLDYSHTAELIVDDEVVGIAGKIDAIWMQSKLDVPRESDAFMFDLDADFILSYKTEVSNFEPLSKYQEVTFDLSCFTPLEIETATLEKILRSVNEIVSDVRLIDFFEKKEWTDKRSLAFRVTLTPPKTLDGEEIEKIRSQSIASLEKLGVTLRV